MTAFRGFLSVVLLTSGAALLPASASAQGAATRVAVANAMPPAEQKWITVQCGTCAKAGVSVEYHRLPETGGRSPEFFVARVRNLTQREVKGSIDVFNAELPDSEGHMSSQLLWFVLGPLGNANGEQVVLLPYPMPVSAVAYSVGQW